MRNPPTMAQKKTATDEELLAQFDGIASTDPPPPTSSTPSRSGLKPSKPALDNSDPLAELESLAKAKPTSRPNTPKLSSTAGLNRTRSPVRRDAHTPPSSGSGRNSEDKTRASALPRRSGESTRSFHQGLAPASEESQTPGELGSVPETEKQQSGGGWWGGIFATASATASAAVKQAEAAVKEIQQNEEAQKWAQQVRGNVGALRGLGKQPSTVMLVSSANAVVQEVNSAPVRFLRSQTSCIPSPRPSPSMNASKSTSPMT
jgi:hypothetical protein